MLEADHRAYPHTQQTSRVESWRLPGYLSSEMDLARVVVRAKCRSTASAADALITPAVTPHATNATAAVAMAVAGELALERSIRQRRVLVRCSFHCDPPARPGASGDGGLQLSCTLWDVL